MKKMPVFLGVAVAVLTLASCEKELEHVNDSPQTTDAASALAKPDLLATGNWHQTGLTVSAPATSADAAPAISDLFAQAKPSMLIKAVVYKADGTFSLMRGPRPGSQSAEPVTGKWRLTAPADSLILTQGDRTRRFAVAELTASSLRLAYSDAAAGGKASLFTSAFAH
jgi:hypothetical protein